MNDAPTAPPHSRPLPCGIVGGDVAAGPPMPDADPLAERARATWSAGDFGRIAVTFAPSAAEIERAKALVAAFDGGAERFGDEMIERMHVEAARRLLERAST